MANPIAFPSTTTHFSLPLLFAGQAQKEPFINHTFSVLDSLLAGVVDDSLASPPTNPSDGERYRILENGTGEWLGHDQEIAVSIAGSWQFVLPQSGMAIFDATSQANLYFDGSWQIATEPSTPNGGSVVDSEAREAILGIILALRTAGVFARSS